MQSGRGVFIGPVLAAERHFQMSDDVKTRIAQLSRFRRWQHMTNTRAFVEVRVVFHWVVPVVIRFKGSDRPKGMSSTPTANPVCSLHHPSTQPACRGDAPKVKKLLIRNIEHGMKFIERHPFADPFAAARKIIEIANGVAAEQNGRIFIERINEPFLVAGGSGREFLAGVERAIALGWVRRRESGTCPKFTDSGAALFA
jgi:hypothetical protein